MIIKQDYIELTEKYNGTLRNLWIDPFLINILKIYFQLLDEEKYDTSTISNVPYIKKVLEANRLREEAKVILFTDAPIKYV